MLVEAIATLARNNGIPADAVINSWHFTTASADPAVFGPLIGDRLEEFYADDVAPPGGAAAVADVLSSELSGDITVTVRQVGVAPPTPVLYTETFTAPIPQAVDALPGECALALSYHGDLDLSPRARARGRIFIGPIAQAYNNDGVDGLFRPIAQLRDILRFAADRLMVANDPLEVEWGVWSRTGSTFATTVGGWVDDAWDTIRSRGPKALTRGIWPA